jgi:hypothetical protein
MPLSLVGRFLLGSLFWLFALMLPWYYVASFLAVPAVTLASEIMRLLFPWVEGVELTGTVATLLTQVSVLIPQGNRNVVGYISPDGNYLVFGYGTVLFWALMLASKPTRLGLKLLVGSVALIPVQAWGLCFQWLKGVAFNGGLRAQQYTGLQGWELEGIAYGYQFGVLILTPLVPVLLWVLMNRSFIARLWVAMTLRGALDGYPAGKSMK